MKFDSQKIYRIEYYLVNLRNEECCNGYNPYSRDQSEAISIIDKALEDAEADNYRLERERKEKNQLRKAARKAGEQAKTLIHDCSLAFIVDDGWFPATQFQAIKYAVSAARNAFLANPELRDAA